MHSNPILWMDYPDPDVIRVDDTYYMISTTMHFMPGGVILRSYDLVHWEIASYVFQSLDDTPAQRLEDGENIYGRGMWAASLRYHKGVYYVCFVAKDTRKTYLYRAQSINGPWHKQYIEGYYHDCSLLFDDDGRAYIVYGNTDIYLTELNDALTAPKLGGLHRLIISDRGSNVRLGYEGAHTYKINGRYYVFLIHWLHDGSGLRTQACFHSVSLRGTFTGRDVLSDDMGFADSGVAQGGLVDTPAGDWYAMLFQDHGAAGRMPVLVPVRWEGIMPLFDLKAQLPADACPVSTRPDYTYEPLFASDDLRRPAGKPVRPLHPAWQWNHTPDDALWRLDDTGLCITARTLCANVTQARNTLTQRMAAPRCRAAVTVDGRDMKDGDVAGLCAFGGNYGLIALTKEKGRYTLTVITRTLDTPPDRMVADDTLPGSVALSVPVDGPEIRLQLRAAFYGPHGAAHGAAHGAPETVSFYFLTP
ncbi:MAG TPA: family 43 glycosylhydrolase, partial [Candidatus Limiplasma sp.]|nr:family 43 glycosylhydrolase [Candidatus Limiplasma sp.]